MQVCIAFAQCSSDMVPLTGILLWYKCHTSS